MDALGQEVELLDAVDRHDHLAVEHDARRVERQHLLDHVGEVPVHGLAVAALQVHVVPVAEDDRAKAVELRLVAPAVALGQLARGLGQLGLEGWGERQGHEARTLAWPR